MAQTIEAQPHRSLVLRECRFAVMGSRSSHCSVIQSQNALLQAGVPR
ncbi:hypothetical protein MED222_06445 [Vibrio sp. MED222]|nr:hypothetical protein MED222_06445 [Vibrio sp. MED222]